MTAPTTQPEAIDAALPDFDADVACELPNKSSGEPCGAPAVWWVRVHGFRHAQSVHCAVHNLLMCDPCLNYLRTKMENELSRGPMRCRSCGARVVAMSDIFKSVVAL